MRDDDLGMCMEARLYPAGLPVPEDDVPGAVPAADPLAVWRKPYLTRVPRDGVPREPLLAVLPEVVCAVDEDLVVEGLGGEVFFWKDG